MRHVKRFLFAVIRIVMRVGCQVYVPPGRWFCRLTGMSNTRAARELYIIASALTVAWDLHRGRWVYLAVVLWGTVVLVRLIPEIAADVERLDRGEGAIHSSTVLILYVTVVVVIAALASLVADVLHPTHIELVDVGNQIVAVAMLLLFNPQGRRRSAVREAADRLQSVLETRLRAA